MIPTKPATISTVATVLPPVRVRIREINGFSASEISRMSRKDKRMGAKSVKVLMKTSKAAPANI